MLKTKVIADIAQQHVKSLVNYGVAVNPEIIVALVEGKLSPSVALEWDKTLKRDELPTPDALFEFLYGTAARLSMHESKVVKITNASTASSIDTRSHKRKAQSQHRSFSIQAKKASIDDANCAVCSEKHLLFQCDNFKKMGVENRYKVVKEAKFCLNCLKREFGHKCISGNCRICGKKHNTLLHNPKFVSRVAKQGIQ